MAYSINDTAYSNTITCYTNNTGGNFVQYAGTTCGGGATAEGAFATNACLEGNATRSFRVVCSTGNAAPAVDPGFVASAVAGVSAALLAWM